MAEKGNSDSPSIFAKIVNFIVSCVASLLVLAIGVALVLYKLNPGMGPSDEEIYWDWDKIDTSDLLFPADFQFGTSTAAHQVEGNCTNNQWYLFEQKPGFIHAGDLSNEANDHWNLFKTDIDLMKDQLFVNSYRFSIEWSKVEPEMGRFDDHAVAHYHQVVDALLEAGIKPMITLHHFTDPLWFYKLGAFERSENIEHFVRFAKFIYRQFSSKVNLWCTINEPQVYSLVGYAIGYFPPQKKDPHLAITVLKNLLEAHVQVYHELKSLPGGDKTTIGMALNLHQFDPYSPRNPVERIVVDVLNLFNRDCIFNFLKTGEFKVFIPFVASVYHKNPRAINSMDYFGLNYYGNAHIKFDPTKLFSEPIANVTKKNRELTDFNWYIYPEGLYRSIKLASSFNLPIYVTENGIADAKDTMREKFIKRYIYAVNRAMKEGTQVKGYYYWSFMDNFEWRESRTMRFGLFKVDYATQKRQLYKGSQAYVDIVKRFLRK